MLERVLELSVILVAAGRLLGVAAMPAARRECREHPVLAVAGIGAGVVALAVVLWAARTSTPWALRSLVALTLSGWAVLALRAHPSYGRWRGLPPGSLGVRESLRAIVERDFYAQTARRHGAVFKMAQFHRAVACIPDLAAGQDILRRHGDALHPPPLPMSAAVPRGFLRYMTPADHATYSRLFRSAVSEATLRAIEPFAVATTAGALADLVAESERTGAHGTRPHATVERYLHTILLRLYFGGLLHPEDGAVIAAYQRDADLAGATGKAAPRAVRALRRFEALITTRAAAHDAASDASIWSGLLRLEPDAARDPTVLGNLFLLLGASQHSISGLLTWMFALMSGAPAWCALARSRRAADADSSVCAVLETLRLAQSEYVYREVVHPITIGGFVIPRGWLLRICVAESHREPATFPDPDRFDPDRHIGRPYGSDVFSPFGIDLHACLGARMTLLLGRILAHQLIHDVEWEVCDDGPAERGNRHWLHWQPSARFRIAMRRRADANA